MYLNKTLNTFLDDLGAKSPIPGGGSAAALTGATGTSLLSMVANFTITSERYADVRDEFKLLIENVREKDILLRKLIDKDIEAYAALSKFLSSSQDHAGAEELYKEAARAPFSVCEICAECMRICQKFALKANKSLITDTAIAAILFDAAFFSAKFNVYINLKYIKDTEFIGKMHSVLRSLEKELPELKEEILELCEDAII